MNLVATDLSLNFSLSVTIIQVREAADHIDTVNIYFLSIRSDPAVKSFIYVSYKQRWCIHLGQEDQQSHAD